MESLRALFRPLNARRAIVLALFIALVVVFRHLLVLLVFFVAFERPLGWATGFLARRTRLPRSLALLLLVLLLLGGVGTLAMFGVGHGLQAFTAARETLPERIAALKETPLFARLEAYAGAERLVELAKRYAEHAFDYLRAAGRLVIHALLGFILAIVYLSEEHELTAFAAKMDAKSLGGTLLRWLGYMADAASVTLQFQIVVALCNAVLTFPVLLLVGIPHAAAFFFMVFVSGMVPVVGNFVAGSILTLLAYQAKGWVGVGLFIGLTFVLHKAESYYLNPRLAARHVRLPTFVLLVSLVLWETLFGIVGLFLSFPFLYVAARLHEEFVEEDAGATLLRRVDVGVGT
jgi:predicted PurR-regulated permease PerM